MTLGDLTTALVKLLARHEGEIEVVSCVAELELPIDLVRVVDVLPIPGGQVVQCVTRMDAPPVQFSTEPGTETQVEHSAALVEAVAVRVLSGAVMEALNRLVVAWDVLQPCVLTSSTKHSPQLLVDAINDARWIVEQGKNAPKNSTADGRPQ